MNTWFKMAGLALAVSINGVAVADSSNGSGAHLERIYAFNGAMPTGVTVTETGRIFVNFP